MKWVKVQVGEVIEAQKLWVQYPVASTYMVVCNSVNYYCASLAEEGSQNIDDLPSWKSGTLVVFSSNVITSVTQEKS